jgi:hypothetical protein
MLEVSLKFRRSSFKFENAYVGGTGVSLEVVLGETWISFNQLEFKLSDFGVVGVQKNQDHETYGISSPCPSWFFLMLRKSNSPQKLQSAMKRQIMSNHQLVTDVVGN